MPSQPVIALRNVSFSYNSAEEPLFAELSAHFPSGFTGIVGANGAGKTTLLRLLIGELAPTSGVVDGSERAVYCAQRTDKPPHMFNEFLQDWNGEACALRDRLGISADYLERWEHLSHGERKRAQIAHALWQQPSVMAIDEPTNHIDAHARDMLLASLKRFAGVGLIVSHDRELLDELCTQTLWLAPPEAQLFTGGITQAGAQKQSSRETAIREHRQIVNENKKLQREIYKRREAASREHRIRSKKGLSRKDSDAREKINRARVTDSGAGKPFRQLGGRFEQAQARLKDSRVEKDYATGIWLEGSQSSRNAVLKMQAGEVALDADRVLKWPELIIRPNDRIAITGRNGVGKSTWLNYALGLLNVPRDHVVFLPQEVTAAAAQKVLADARALPKAQLGHIMNIVSRLNSRPNRLLESRQPSPGEARKLLFAMGISALPHIIVMDEPTNHLDLPSIEALEKALADCPCALLLVSHDRHFLDKIGAQRWNIEVDKQGNSRLSREEFVT